MTCPVCGAEREAADGGAYDGADLCRDCRNAGLERLSCGCVYGPTGCEVPCDWHYRQMNPEDERADEAYDRRTA